MMSPGAARARTERRTLSGERPRVSYVRTDQVAGSIPASRTSLSRKRFLWPMGGLK